MPALEGYPLYNTKTFNQIYEECDSMLLEFRDSPFNYVDAQLNPEISDDTICLTWALLTAKHGNSPIKNISVSQFKMKLFSTIFSFAPTFVKKLELQKQLRNLSADEMAEGTKQINDRADNPEYASSAGTELDYISGQNVSRIKKSKVQAITDVWDMLSPDLTGEYINQFNKLFSVFLNDGTKFVTREEDD